MMEFWGRLDVLRGAVLAGESETAGQLLEEISAGCLIGDARIDGMRLELLRTIAQIGDIPFQGESVETPGMKAARPAEFGRAIRQRYHDLPFWGGNPRLGQIQVDPALAVPVLEHSSGGVVDFVVRTDALAALGLAEVETLDAGAIYSCLAQARREVNAARIAEALVSYECYLDLISKRLSFLGLRKLHSLLDGYSFEAALRREPSLPFTLLGAALSRFRVGDDVRGYTLLRRLASSEFPEGKQAQRLLAGRVSREDQA
jgi:hypothetical protein